MQRITTTLVAIVTVATMTAAAGAQQVPAQHGKVVAKHDSTAKAPSAAHASAKTTKPESKPAANKPAAPAAAATAAAPHDSAAAAAHAKSHAKHAKKKAHAAKAAAATQTDSAKH